MTTGRINQVRAIGGARARRAPPARVRAPTRARAPQGPALPRAPSRFVGRHTASARSRRLRMPGARLPAPWRSVPQAGPGAELPMRGGPHGRSLASTRPAPPSASARSRRLQMPGRVSPCLGGACLRPGWGPSCPCGVAPSGARSPAPGLRRPRLASPRPRLLLVHTFGAPAPPRVKPWDAPRDCQAAYCDSDEGMRPVGHSQRASPGTAAQTERHLQVTRRPPLASRPGPVSTRRRTGARIRTPHGWPPARAWLRRRAELPPWPPPEALPPCALRADPTRLPHTICSGTMRACAVFGRGGETSSPPKMGGEERGLLLLPSRFREGRSVGRAGRRAAPARGFATERGTLADGREGGLHRNR